ncbi:MAG TPA: acyl-CoA dehydrogenase family protein [Phycisphaerae bacterium]|nr:acyl-CoA dehydrogenase family protein [Phycisphaerae bacterium]HNU45951.1 acyl-CoA dehydrogenase family protein [Phycisphaerae bacterium]
MPLAPFDSSLSDDERVLVEAARDFARSELLPLDRKWDEDETSVVGILPQLADMGLMNLCLPPEVNGLGCSYRAYAAILHEIAWASPSTMVTLSVHNMVGCILDACAREPQRTEWLSTWGSAESLAAFALTEANAGSDAAAVRATAAPTEGGYLANGEKMWITNGMHARWFLTLLRVPGRDAKASLTAFLIDGRQPGIERTHIHGKMGIRGSETAVISLTDVFIPQDHVVGELGEGLKVLLTTLNEGRIGIATQASGIAEACLDEMTAYARERVQFGQPIGNFQAVGNMIADSAVELEAAKVLIWNAATHVDRGVKLPAASSMAKLYATEAANRIAYRAVQVHGGSGYVREFRVEQLYRDARVTTIYEGTSEVQRIVIGRGL